MLNKKILLTVKLLLPHLLLLGAIIFFVSLKETPPKVVALTEDLAANTPFSITYNKPLKTEALEGKMIFSKNGEKIPGTFKTTTTTIVFSPTNPWQAGATYQVNIASLPSDRGDRASLPLEASFHIQKEKLLFLSPDERLMEGDPETGEVRTITPEDKAITEFALAPSGRFVAVYNPKGDAYSNGLVFGEQKNSDYTLTFLPVVQTPRYSEVNLCNNGQQLLMLSATNTSDNQLQYFDLDWEQKGAKKIAQGWQVKNSFSYEGKDMTCSEDTARFIYRNESGAFVSNFLGEDLEELLGVFDVVVGFSPKDTVLMLQKFVTETGDTVSYRSEVSLYPGNGESVTLSEPNTLFEKASFNGNSSLFALLYTDGESFESRVELYTPEKNNWVTLETIYSPENKRIRDQKLSLDGSLIALEIAPKENIRIPTDTPEILLWNLSENKESGLRFQGKSPQWKK